MSGKNLRIYPKKGNQNYASVNTTKKNVTKTILINTKLKEAII